MNAKDNGRLGVSFLLPEGTQEDYATSSNGLRGDR